MLLKFCYIIVFLFLFGCSKPNVLILLPDAEEISSSFDNQEASSDILSSSVNQDINSTTYSLHVEVDSNFIIEVDDQIQLNCSYTGYSDPVISYLSEDEDVLIVDETGLITAKHAGIGSVIVFIKDFDNSNPHFERLNFDVTLKGRRVGN